MMVATGIVILEMTQESDASATDGLATYNFFFAKQGDTSWTTHQGSGYNAFIALKATLDDKFYGYVSSMMGVKEANTSTETQSIWDYWSIYIGSAIAQDGSNYSLFTGGFLTPLSGLGSQYECSELCYQFVHSVYP